MFFCYAIVFYKFSISSCDNPVIFIIISFDRHSCIIFFAVSFIPTSNPLAYIVFSSSMAFSLRSAIFYILSSLLNLSSFSTASFNSLFSPILFTTLYNKCLQLKLQAKSFDFIRQKFLNCARQNYVSFVYISLSIHCSPLMLHFHTTSLLNRCLLHHFLR